MEEGVLGHVQRTDPNTTREACPKDSMDLLGAREGVGGLS